MGKKSLSPKDSQNCWLFSRVSRAEGSVINNDHCRAGTFQANQSHGLLVFRDLCRMSRTTPFSADLNYRCGGSGRQ